MTIDPRGAVGRADLVRLMRACPEAVTTIAALLGYAPDLDDAAERQRERSGDDAGSAEDGSTGGEDENLDEVQVVLGVGIMERLGQVGYSSLSRRELIQEMLIGSVDHNHELLISQWLPRAMKRAKFSPVFYPLYLAGRLDADGQPDNVDDLPKRARDLIRGIGLEPYPARDLNQRLLKSFRELVDEDLDDAINIGVGCTFKTIEDVVLLKDVLLSEAKKDVSTEISTKLAKLACKFDRIVYGPEWEGDKGELHAALAIPQVESKLPQTTLPQSA